LQDKNICTKNNNWANETIVKKSEIKLKNDEEVPRQVSNKTCFGNSANDC